MKIISKGLFKSIKEFKLLDRKLGSGSFGVVRLALHRATGKLYAIKIIDLVNVPSQTQLKLIERQIRLHSQLINPYCIALWDTIKEDECIYMILEYAERGNLFFHQNGKQIFTEPEAGIYFAQTVKAVEYLHGLDIMHRDIKPENMLLDHSNNIKLCDFGWCAENIHNQRSTFCGTYEYMAPEMLFHSNYDYRIDIWALGVLLYEMVHGYAPFRGESVKEVKQHMLKGSYQLSDSLSESLKGLITEILKYNPQERIKLKEILNHQWLKDVQETICNCVGEMDQSNISNIHTLLYQFADKPPKEGTALIGKRQQKSTKNISFNLSINNYAYPKPLDRTQRSNFNSPSEAYMQKKKKKEKRFRTQAEEQLIQLAHSFSPKKILSKEHILRKEKEKKSTKKSVLKQKTRKSQQITDRQLFRGYETNDFFARNPSKLSSIVKKKSIHDKLNSAVSSMKNIHKVKTGSRVNITNLSGLNY